MLHQAKLQALRMLHQAKLQALIYI
jgi:hypothetical protein